MRFLFLRFTVKQRNSRRESQGHSALNLFYSMDDGTINFSVAPQITRTGGGNLRRYSMGRASSFDTVELSIPHYRRASIGSCHDVCKYGHKHSFEAKARDPIRKRAMRRSLDGQNLDRVVPMAELKASPESKTSFFVATKSEVPVNSSSRSSLEAEVLTEGKKLVAKTKTLPKAYNSKTSKTTIVSSFKNAEVYTTSQEMRSPKKLDSVLKSKTSKVKVKVISPYFSQSTMVQRNSNFETDRSAKTSKGTEKKVVANPKVFSYPKYVVKNKSMEVVSLLKSQNKLSRAQTNEERNVETLVKTLHITHMETEEKLIVSDQNEKNASGLCLKLPPVSDCLSEHQNESEEHARKEADTIFSESNEFYSFKREEASEVSKNFMPLRMFQSKEKDSSSLSSKFRTGKVVELQSESASPRRLRFRAGRLLVQNQKSIDGWRRSFKKVAPNEPSKDSMEASEKVVLRHQDLQEKKDDQVLFNNVIEETASKLVRARRSKVMALVGAFETVISLQDNKLSLKTAA